MSTYKNTSIRNLVYRLRKFKPILEDSLKEEIEKYADFLVDSIRVQLDMGLDGFDNKIQPPYALRTIKYKTRKGQPTDRVTLRDTGDFHASIHIEFDDKGFNIVSSDEKVKYLFNRYGKSILRLSDSDLTNFLNIYIRPALARKMKEYLENGRT